MKTQRLLLIPFSILLISALILTSCNLPGGVTPQPTPTVTPRPLPSLPPALVETYPPAGGQVPLQPTITLYFSQPMERASVESAITFTPELGGTFDWLDDSTLDFTPGQKLSPDSGLVMVVGTGAKGQNGLAFTEPAAVAFRTADSLQVLEMLPEPGTSDVMAASAIVAAFNQPVVSLGADPAQLPGAFSLRPATTGRGEWINTSTYIFYPDPPLAGGVIYTAQINPSLQSTMGGPLAADTQTQWSFTAAMPRVVSISPDAPVGLALDASLVITFNTPMDPDSVESNFLFRNVDTNVAVPGTFEWSEDAYQVTFTPSIQLERNTDYELVVRDTAQARGGSPLEEREWAFFRTYPFFYVSGTNPADGEVKTEYGSVEISLSAPLDVDDVENYVNISPQIPSLSVNARKTSISLYGYFDPGQLYTVTISADLRDRWGMRLGEKYEFEFLTPPAKTSLSVPYLGSNALFVRAIDPEIQVQATNVSGIDITLGAISLEKLIDLNRPENYQERQNFMPGDPLNWNQELALESDKSQVANVSLSPFMGTLEPGLYHLTLQGWSGSTWTDPEKNFIIASNVNLTLKAGMTDALIWAVDLRTNKPIANAPAALYDQEGRQLASGQTDADGLWETAISPLKDSSYYYAVLGEPGEDRFGMAITGWNQEITPWDFDLSYTQQPPRPVVYFYTDRPIYRPGQTVYFRAVVREKFDGRYSDAGVESLTFDISDGYGQNWGFNLPVSNYGTADGSFTLPEEAQPGYYSIDGKNVSFYGYFDVADYRKPEINLGVSMTPENLRADDSLQVEIDARYYFDAPAAGVSIDWRLYRCPAYFSLPNHRVGMYDYGWMNIYYDFDGRGCQTIDSDQTVTGADGLLELSFSDLPPIEDIERIILEATAQDESGFPVSARAEVYRHPADYYIGLRPDAWIGQAGMELGFEVLTVDWEKDPSPSHTLEAQFLAVAWKREVTYEYSWAVTRFVPVYTPIAASDLATGADGVARLSFTPTSPGTYMLDVQGDGVRSQVMLWVGGAQQAIWPNLMGGQVRLSGDKDSYRAGETAQVFIPNPLGPDTLALVTIELGTIRTSDVIQISGAGVTYPVPLTEDSAPNIYVAATLIGGEEFRQGYVNLVVEPKAQTLNVMLTSTPARSEPGGEVTFDLRVTDWRDQPVQGEFSLSVVDLAALALADPNSSDILPFFYSNQPLGVLTSLALAAETSRALQLPGGGKGGGGGGAAIVVREEFPDTAYWNATIVTNTDGRASVSLALPDNLTTWRVQVRGLTQDTRVGQTEFDLVTSKDLLVRPVTPRFLVVGDHIELGAIVHNNTASPLKTTVTLQADNLTLDDSSQASQQVDIPAGGRMLVTWWGTALDGETADLVFSAQAGNLGDASRPTMGPIPILHYVAPQTFSTSGILSSSGTELEVLSLPRSFDPTGGELTVELSPSLAATLLSGLDAIGEPPDTCSNEYLLSYILPNVELYRSLQASGLEDPEIETRMAGDIQSAINILMQRQRGDYGWGWWGGEMDTYTWERTGGESSPFLTAYIIFGLNRASQAGLDVDWVLIDKARNYLIENLPISNDTLDDWQLDLLAFEAYVLQDTGGVDPQVMDALYGNRDRLSTWSQALLAMTIESAIPGDAWADELLSNLETTAIRSATGAHWESDTKNWYLPGTPLYTSAMVVYALAQNDPASPLLADAVRYLSAQRDGRGWWHSSYETAWVILALNAYMIGTGGYAADFSFDAYLNGLPFAQGEAAGPSSLTTVTAVKPVSELLPDLPNALNISRSDGVGSLYYRAALQVYKPVELAEPLSAGLSVSRAYYLAGCGEACLPVGSIQLDTDARLTARLTLTVAQDAYFVNLEDYIPAGAEILNPRLKTSQQYGDLEPEAAVYDPDDPYANGWGWWYFDNPRIFDDHILWTAEYLPAGTYMLTYTLVPVQAGEYRVIPAHAWLAFFPEVQGTSAGAVLEINR